MRRTLTAPVLAIAAAAAAVGVAAAMSRVDDWRSPGALALLLGFAIVADRMPVLSRSGTELVGSMPIYVLAAVLFGPAPAVAVGIATTLVLPPRDWRLMVGDVAAFSAFPLAAGAAARAGVGQLPDPRGLWLIVLCVGVFFVAWTVNIASVAAYQRLLRGRSLRLDFVATWLPLLPMQAILGLATGGLAYGYVHQGAAVIVLAGVLIITYSRLQRELIAAERTRDLAQERNAELERVNERLRRSHYGAMRSLVKSIHLHDRMTARHSAAVARYARGIARAIGCSEDDQHLVHTAGLLHDVGKHIFDDAILKGDTKLTDEQWEIVRRHPEEGARVVRMLEGHDAVAEIILAHHERIDGGGYPRGLSGDEIPLLARMISIADCYDVMTARDSYREPMTEDAAAAELRRVAGRQLDAALVEVFLTQVVGHEATAFTHGDDADFEQELAFDARVRADGLFAPEADDANEPFALAPAA